jgi:uncharacterized protein involved in exopolysaccharide biosynthesis
VNGWPAYLATWRRHRLLLCIPIVLAVAVAAWTVVGAAKSYDSSASLWVDNGGPGGSTLGNANSADGAVTTSPSQEEQSALQELLATKQFVTAVGSRSSLSHYLARHPTAGFGPPALVAKVFGDGSIATRVASAMRQGVSSTVVGPQVFALSFSGPSPAVARSTLAALVSQLRIWAARYSEFYGQTETGYFQSQLTLAQQAVQQTDAQAQAYLADHPRASVATDPVYNSLVGAAGAASTQLTQAQSGLAAARSASRGNAQSLVTRVIDAPSLPANATHGAAVDLEGVFAGLAAGLVISVLIIVLMTSTARRPDRWLMSFGEEDKIETVPTQREQGAGRV